MPAATPLFTLVGIAGEDDLDAPDLCDGRTIAADVSCQPRAQADCPISRGMPSRTPGNGRDRGVTKGEAPCDHRSAEQSAALRDRLLAEIGNIPSAELAAGWAREALAAKNKLAAPDAKLVEDAFEQQAVGARFSRNKSLRTMMLPQLPMQILKRRQRPQAPTLTNPTASTRASSPLPHRGAIATGSTFALSPSSRA